MEYTAPREKFKALPLQLIELEDAVVVKRGRSEIKVSGEHAADVFRALLPIAFRGATLDEMAAAFAAPQRESILALLDHLVSRRFIVAVDQSAQDAAEPADGAGDHEESSLDVFYWHFGVTAAEVTRRLTMSRLRLVGVNMITRQIAASLRQSGAGSTVVIDDPLLRNPSLFDADDTLRRERWLDDAEDDAGAAGAGGAAGDAATIEPGGAFDLDPGSVDAIVASSDLGNTRTLSDWNEFCVLHEIAYLPVLLHDLIGYVGPLVRPFESACYECLRSRQNAHLTDARARRAVESVTDPALVAVHPSMTSILGDLAALEVLKLAGLGGSLAQPGTLIEVNFLGREMKPRRVLRVPRCRVCSSLGKRPAVPLLKTALLSNGGV